MKLLIHAYLLLLTGAVSPGICQMLPTEPPVREVDALYVPVQWIWPHAPAYRGWAATLDHTQLTSPLPPNGTARLILTRPRHRPISIDNFAGGEPHKTEWNGRIWRNGQSRHSNNQPPYLGWLDNVDRQDCTKGWASSATGWTPPVIRIRYEGEEHFTNVGFLPGQEHPYIAESLDLAFRGGVFVGARWQVDHGSGCAPAYGGATFCRNPACARYMICAEPWVYPNHPCGTCGELGDDPTRRSFFVGEYTSWSMIPAWGQSNPWEDMTPRPQSLSAWGTVAQAVSAAGTPMMAAQMIQTEAYATMGRDLFTPTRTVHAYADGLYVVYVDQLRIRRLSAALGVRAELRMRFWRLWSFDQAGLFGFIADWFGGRDLCDLDGDGCVAAPDLFAFLAAWFGEG